MYIAVCLERKPHRRKEKEKSQIAKENIIFLGILYLLDWQVRYREFSVYPTNCHFAWGKLNAVKIEMVIWLLLTPFMAISEMFICLEWELEGLSLKTQTCVWKEKKKL